jgi:hypothetical protein
MWNGKKLADGADRVAANDMERAVVLFDRCVSDDGATTSR